MTDKFTVARLILDGEKFELLVKPDPALEYKMGKRTDISSVLVSDEIYSDANKGSRASSETMMKQFKTADSRSEEHTSELQSRQYLVCRLLLEKKQKYLVFSI